LLDGIEHGGLRAGDLSLMQKQQLARYPIAELRSRAKVLLKQGNQNISDDRRSVLSNYIDLASAKGNVAAGKEVFTKHCATCHRYHGDGASIGPDLSGMSVHGKEQLLGHILDPNRDVEGNYQAYTVVTTEGRVLNGLVAGESATSIELIDAEGKRTPILRDDVEELIRTGASLMPEGFEKQLSRDQISDVLEFLTQRSPFVPLDVRRVATVSSAHGMFETPRSRTESLVFEDWGIKTFEGVPFYPVDPEDGRVPNVVMLRGELGTVAPKMPHRVELQCGVPAKAIHFLSGVSGWGFPTIPDETVTITVRLHYADDRTEDHELKNGIHFADYLGNAEVSGSKLAFSLGRQQMRYLKITPKRDVTIDRVELIKGPNRTAPVVMCITVERS
jgi:putative heme-binding domain-containing protein